MSGPRDVKTWEALWGQQFPSSCAPPPNSYSRNTEEEGGARPVALEGIPALPFVCCVALESSLASLCWDLIEAVRIMVSPSQSYWGLW